MKILDQLALRARTTRRRAAGRLGLSPLPASVCLRLDDLDEPVVTGVSPRPVGASLDLAGWEQRVIGLVLALGPVPVRVVARAGHPLLADVARFAGRLECPVTMRTAADGLDKGRARELVDAGLRRVEVVATGGVGPDVVGAVEALAAARTLRGMRYDIVVEVPAGALAAAVDPAALGAELRTAGADGVRVGVPWGGRADPAALAAMREWHASFHRTEPAAFALLERMDGQGPGAPRHGGRCGVGSGRVEVGADGVAYACPFKGSPVQLGEDGDLAGLAAQRKEIAACPRECGHADLG